jgi:hypothetical protein
MTVVAIGRGEPGSYNVLLADSTVGTGTGSCERQKIAACSGSTFCTVIGDDNVRDATVWLAMWHDPRALDYQHIGTAKAVFAAGARRRMLAKTVVQSLPPVNVTTLFICSHESAFYWQATLSSGGRGPDSYVVAPPLVEISPSQLWVLYGGEQPVTYPMQYDSAHPFHRATMCIDQVHQAHAAAERIPMVSGRRGGVVIPHDYPTASYQWQWPTRTLPELWARENPNSPLKRDATFLADLPIPHFRPTR